MSGTETVIGREEEEEEKEEEEFRLNCLLQIKY
jgi:hypothetical protein